MNNRYIYARNKMEFRENTKKSSNHKKRGKKTYKNKSNKMAIRAYISIATLNVNG